MNLPSQLIDSSAARIVLVVPSRGGMFGNFKIRRNAAQHARLIRGIQRLRATEYLRDGAIQPWQVTKDGRHVCAADEKSWHVVALDPAGTPVGCARYLSHENTVGFDDLQIRSSALAQAPVYGPALARAVEAEIARARALGVAYVEAGGWAVASTHRRTSLALRIALCTFGLARALGGSIGVSAATVRNCSAAILKRLGGAPLRCGDTVLPPYFDPQYGCGMEILRFESKPSPRYVAQSEQVSRLLQMSPAIGPDQEADCSGSLVALGRPWGSRLSASKFTSRNYK